MVFQGTWNVKSQISGMESTYGDLKIFIVPFYRISQLSEFLFTRLSDSHVKRKLSENKQQILLSSAL